MEAYRLDSYCLSEMTDKTFHVSMKEVQFDHRILDGILFPLGSNLEMLHQHLVAHVVITAGSFYLEAFLQVNAFFGKEGIQPLVEGYHNLFLQKGGLIRIHKIATILTGTVTGAKTMKRRSFQVKA